MRRVTMLALAAMLMVPAAGGLQAQGKGETRRQEHGQAKRQDSGRLKRQESDHVKQREGRLVRRDGKPGRRVGPSPYGPGRRVGPDRQGRRDWGGYVIGRRGDLDLSDRQVSEITVIRDRYGRDYERYDREYARTSGGTKDRDDRYATTTGGRKQSTAEQDRARKMAEVRARERREIEAVLTPAQRGRLKQSSGDEKSTR